MKAKLNFHRSIQPPSPKNPILVLVPGGGCFSGASWGPVDTLLRSFDVITVDPPGTGGLPKLASYTYEDVISAIERELNTLDRPLVLTGISFGATYAADLATRGTYDVAGYVGFAAPISVEGFRDFASVPNPHYTPAMQAAEEIFDKNPNEETWVGMLDAIAEIYFSKKFIERGRKLLLEDKSHFKSYLDVFFPYVKGEVKTDLTDRIRGFTGTKRLVAGEADHLVPADVIRRDAASLGIPFESIPDASHFVLLEQPAATASLFEKLFSKSQKQ